MDTLAVLAFPFIFQVAVIRVLLVVWCIGLKVLKVASILARELLTQMMSLPGLIFGEKAVVIMMAVSRVLPLPER